LQIESVGRYASGVKLLIFLAALLLGFAVAGYAAKRHDDRLWRDYKRIRPGMSVTQATTILGQPSSKEACGHEFGGPPRTCSVELVYRAALAPLNPLYWVVEIDSENRVISADWMASP